MFWKFLKLVFLIDFFSLCHVGIIQNNFQLPLFYPLSYNMHRWLILIPKLINKREFCLATFSHISTGTDLSVLINIHIALRFTDGCAAPASSVAQGSLHPWHVHAPVSPETLAISITAPQGQLQLCRVFVLRDYGYFFSNYLKKTY